MTPDPTIVKEEKMNQLKVRQRLVEMWGPPGLNTEGQINRRCSINLNRLMNQVQLMQPKARGLSKKHR